MDRSWLIAWCGGILLSALIAGGYEEFLRSHGYTPTIQDDADLWSIQYDRVKSSPHAVALLGASRIEFGVDPALLATELGLPVAMLAVNGKYPLATLRALSDDERYAGVVIVGIDSRGMQRKLWDMQQGELDHYKRRWTLARFIHRTLLTGLQERLVLMRSEFSIVRLGERLLAGDGLPRKDYARLRADRGGFAAFYHADLAWTSAKRVFDLENYYRENPPIPPEAWLADLATVSNWIRRIEARGGRVVFFREPVSGESLQLDEANFPRDRYWGAYARISPAKMIDFRDVPELSTLELPDTSHIDGTDVPRLTRALVRAIEDRAP
jgi:hypothetical protein